VTRGRPNKCPKFRPAFAKSFSFFLAWKPNCFKKIPDAKKNNFFRKKHPKQEIHQNKFFVNKKSKVFGKILRKLRKKD
jgi:hypothetical protein